MKPGNLLRIKIHTAEARFDGDIIPDKLWMSHGIRTPFVPLKKDDFVLVIDAEVMPTLWYEHGRGEIMWKARLLWNEAIVTVLLQDSDYEIVYT